MKLYTEEQIKKVIKDSFLQGIERNTNYESVKKSILNSLTPIELPSDSLCINCDESESTHNICMDCIIKIGKENIQLPSDEEINEVAMVVYGFDARDIKDVLEYKAFKRGAKYVINKIQGDNK